MKKTNPKRQAKPVKSGKRGTLNALIEGAPTFAQKWHVALTNGAEPLSPMHQLAIRAAGCAAIPSPEDVAAFKRLGIDLAEDNARIEAEIKAELVGLLFPALVAGDTAPFEQVIQGIRDYRRSQSACAKTVEALAPRQCQQPSKRERGRLQRLALLSLDPDDLLDIGTVQAALEKFDRHPSGWPLFSEDSTIYELMKELEISLLRPGDMVRWRTMDGRTVRLLQILPSGRPKITGPRNPAELERFGCLSVEFGSPAGGDKK
jgi:hypothetical protein